MYWRKINLNLLIFPVLSLLFFYPTYKYGFVTDFLSWLYKYENGNWSDLKNCFGYDGLHHFFHLINFTVYKIIGKSVFGWYVVMALLHGVNGFLISVWVKRLLITYKLPRYGFLTWFVPISFLFSPYAIEPVVWKACLHYLLSFGLIMGGLIYLLEYLQKKGGLWKVHLLFVLALLSLEITLAVPFIYFIFWIAHSLINNEKTKLDYFVKITIPQGLILVLYFLTNKWYLGSWVGHYGEESHLNFDIHLMSGNAFQYLGKHALFLHYLPFKIKIVIYDFINHPFIIVAIILLSLVWIGFLWRRHFRANEPTAILSIFSYVAFFMALFPISNLYFLKTQWYENDRYGYLASVFLCLCIGLLFGKIKWVFLKNIVLFSYLAVLFYCSILTIKVAHVTGEMVHGLVDNFNYYDHEEIVILAIPDNMEGMQMFRDYSRQSLSFIESLYHFAGRKYKGKITEIAQINVKTIKDRIGVDVINNRTLKIKNPNNGSWFWRDGIGLIDYENEDFKVIKKGWFYTLKIKKPIGDRIFIYFDGIEWKQVDFSN